MVLKESSRTERTFFRLSWVDIRFFKNLTLVEESGNPTTVAMAVRKKQKEPPSSVY